jgi:hypothetical protein
MTKWVRGVVLAAGAVLVGVVADASAAAPADVAAAVAPQVVGVVSGGNWEDGGKKGYYRAVLIAPPDASSGAQIFLQWMTAADQASGGVPAVAMVASVQEVAAEKMIDANLSMEFERPNEFILYVEPADPSKAAAQSLTVTATSPGKYSAVKGPLPE